jgi:hypothetical protein
MRWKPLAAIVTLATSLATTSLAGSGEPEVPLTYDAFKGLTVEQGARRLIGSSASIMSQMFISGPLLCCLHRDPPLLSVSFVSAPKASKPGLCEHNWIRVELQTEDGSPMNDALSSTPMRVKSVMAGLAYLVVGDLTEEANERQEAELDTTCAKNTKRAGDFFRAPSEITAWEAAYLAATAVKQARAGDRRKLKLECKYDCTDKESAFFSFSPSRIIDVSQTCSPIGDDNVDTCYDVWIQDTKPGRRWVVNVEAKSVRHYREEKLSGPHGLPVSYLDRITFEIKKSTFTLMTMPII